MQLNPTTEIRPRIYEGIVAIVAACIAVTLFLLIMNAFERIAGGFISINFSHFLLGILQVAGIVFLPSALVVFLPKSIYERRLGWAWLISGGIGYFESVHKHYHHHDVYNPWILALFAFVLVGVIFEIGVWAATYMMKFFFKASPRSIASHTTL